MNTKKEMDVAERAFTEYLDSLGYCYTYEPHDGYCDFLVYKDKNKTELLCLCELKTLGASEEEKNATAGHKRFMDAINDKHSDMPFGLIDYSTSADFTEDYHSTPDWFMRNLFSLYDSFISAIRNYYNENIARIMDYISFILPKDAVLDNQLVEIYDIESNELKAVSVVSESGNYYPISPPYKMKFLISGEIKTCDRLISASYEPSIHLKLSLEGSKDFKSYFVVSPTAKYPRMVGRIEKAYKQLKETAKKEKLNIHETPAIAITYSDVPFICADEVDKMDLQISAHGNSDGVKKVTGRFRVPTGKSPVFSNHTKYRQLSAIALLSKFDNSMKIIPNPYKENAIKKLCNIFTGPNDEILLLNTDNTVDWKRTRNEAEHRMSG